MDFRGNIKIHIITDDNFVAFGIDEVVKSSLVFRNYSCYVYKTIEEFSLYRDENQSGYHIIVNDALSKNIVLSSLWNDKVLFLPTSYRPSEYLSCFFSMRDTVGGDKHLKKLSKKENSIFKFITLGMGDDKISYILNISKKTISAHRRNILKKLNLKNRHALYLYSREVERINNELFN